MKKRLTLHLILFCFISLTLFSQNDLQENYNLMPWPKEVIEIDAAFIINPDIKISIQGTKKKGRVYNASINFLRRLTNRTGIFINEGFPLINDKEASIQIKFDRISTLSLQDDESYSLSIKEKKILISAPTDIGALYALQTLLQLTDYDSNNYYFHGLNINDTPRFVWRGLMIDVARHFQPVHVIKRNLDAMASVKLNVFHWHLTDDQGFRVESKVYPKLQELSSDGLYYTQEQIKEVVNYASSIGIRVIPEFDVPGHASAILTAYPELGSKKEYAYAIERYAGVFDPTLDPTNDKTYLFLKNLFTEIAPLFPDEYFHIGGDENEGKHWDKNLAIQKFKKQHDLKTNHDLQTYFNIKLEEILSNLGKKLMGWDEIMTPNMPTTAVIHSWRGENEGMSKGGSLISAAKKGYQTVLSNGYYIDRMLSVKHHYTVDPIGDVQLTTDERKRILGGEATMWSELVTPLTIDSRIWPRTAAIAERFWSEKEINDIDNMLIRLEDVSNKLEELGITHIRNKEVILRNISNHKDNEALQSLSNLCEPLKVYSRNKGGTEYKTYSPFTLFADACTADAPDAMRFNNITNKLEEESSIIEIKKHLEIWSNNYRNLQPILHNPNVAPLRALSQNLSNTSKILLKAINTKKITQNDLNELKASLHILEEAIIDVELAIVDSLERIIKFCEINYLIK
ncbi:family 20 glycosylhydrolase [Dokdonia sp.]|uniref:beta-N-acetylhexosaminidase n=1 Tax=Dokdonia sp. TaxID=2024995 RepID=UPI0032636061